MIKREIIFINHSYFLLWFILNMYILVFSKYFSSFNCSNLFFFVKTYISVIFTQMNQFGCIYWQRFEKNGLVVLKLSIFTKFDQRNFKILPKNKDFRGCAQTFETVKVGHNVKRTFYLPSKQKIFIRKFCLHRVDKFSFWFDEKLAKIRVLS